MNGQMWYPENGSPANNTSTLFNSPGPFPTSFGSFSNNNNNTQNPISPSQSNSLSGIPSSTSQSSDFFDDYNKDVQVRMLKERLEFTERLLEEKDKQLENYKKMVESLQQIIEMGRRSSSNPSPNPQQQQQPVTTPITRPTPPPGFDTPASHSRTHTSIKGKKSISYASDVDYTRYGREDPETWKKKSNDDNASSWKKSSTSKDDEEFPFSRRSPSMDFSTSPKETSSMAVGSGNPNFPRAMSSPALQVEEGFGLNLSNNSNASTSSSNPREIRRSTSMVNVTN